MTSQTNVDGASMQSIVPQPYLDRDGVVMYQGDCRLMLKHLPEQSVHCCVTSPPYWGLRDYGHEDQIGLERTPDDYIQTMVNVFRDVRRVLRDDGTLWLNLGDTYNAYNGGAGPGSKLSKNQTEQRPKLETGYGLQCKTLKPKDLIGIPWRVALALQADGWWLRQDIIWHKPNPMPESVRDRCTKSHEYIFLLSKSERYYFNCDAIKEDAVCGANGSEFHTGKTGEHQQGRSSKKPRGPGNKTHKGETAYDEGDERHRTKKGLVAYAKKIRESASKGSFNGKTEAMADTGQNAFRAIVDKRNKRSVWSVSLKPYKGAHFATYPQELIEPCVLAGCPEGGTVLDPFIGSGTTAAVARRSGCKFVGFELNPEYLALAEKRFVQGSLQFVG
jgi:DNA modification methylase